MRTNQDWHNLVGILVDLFIGQKLQNQTELAAPLQEDRLKQLMLLTKVCSVWRRNVSDSRIWGPIFRAAYPYYQLNEGDDPYTLFCTLRLLSRDFPLHGAAIQLNHAMIRQLGSHGADINQIDSKGCAPLHYVARSSLNTHQVKPALVALIDLGANLNVRDRSGNTALHYLMGARGHVELLNLLILRGADANTINGTGMSPLYLSIRNGYFNCNKSMHTAGANFRWNHPLTQNNFFHLAAEINDSLFAQNVTSFHKYDGPFMEGMLREQNTMGKTPVMIAAEQGHFEILEIYIHKMDAFMQIDFEFLEEIGEEARLNFNTQKKDHAGHTCFYYLAQHYTRENQAVKKLLLEMIRKHADPNEAISADHSTLLHAVIRRGDTEFLRQLCRIKKIDLNRQDQQGKTALHLAFEFKNIEAAKVLLVAGADANRKDTMIPGYPRTAWQIAFHTCRELLNPLKNFIPQNLWHHLPENKNNFFNTSAPEAEPSNKRCKIDLDQYDYAKNP